MFTVPHKRIDYPTNIDFCRDNQFFVILQSMYKKIYAAR